MAHWKVDVARARWRGDLLEIAAAGLRSIGDEVNAATKDAEAALHREFADVCERFETERTEATKLALIALRSHWRAIGEALGKPPVLVVNNFSEPSDDDLIGAK